MGGIDFSASALQAFQTAIRKQLDVVSGTSSEGGGTSTKVVIEAMKNELAVEPAFGLFPEGKNALTTYKTNFDAAWGDVQRLKSALEAIDEACTTTLSRYDSTETQNTAK